MSIYCPSILYHKSFLGRRTKGKKNKGRDYGGPFGGGGLTTQNGARSKPKPPAVIHNFVRGALNTPIRDIFNPRGWTQSKATKATKHQSNQAPIAPKTSAPRRSCLPFVGCTRWFYNQTFQDNLQQIILVKSLRLHCCPVIGWNAENLEHHPGLYFPKIIWDKNSIINKLKVVYMHKYQR